MMIFARALIGAMFQRLLHRPRSGRTILRAVIVTHAPVQADSTLLQQDECIATFPQQWLALEKRVPVSFMREEAAALIQQELDKGVVFGEEAIKILNIRRRYREDDQWFHGARCRGRK